MTLVLSITLQISVEANFSKPKFVWKLSRTQKCIENTFSKFLQCAIYWSLCILIRWVQAYLRFFLSFTILPGMSIFLGKRSFLVFLRRFSCSIRGFRNFSRSFSSVVLRHAEPEFDLHLSLRTPRILEDPIFLGQKLYRAVSTSGEILPKARNLGKF